MGLGMCLVYGFNSYSMWYICEGLETGSQDLCMFWCWSDSCQCET